jgi:hypothetical protein
LEEGKFLRQYRAAAEDASHRGAGVQAAPWHGDSKRVVADANAGLAAGGNQRGDGAVFEVDVGGDPDVMDAQDGETTRRHDEVEIREDDAASTEQESGVQERRFDAGSGFQRQLNVDIVGVVAGEPVGDGT